ncbi:MAG: hypothetical protein U0T82_17420 [Bacteroidales bacterium]
MRRFKTNLSTNRASWILQGLIVFLMASGCEKIGDLYLGIPLQPKMEDKEFVPGLNILGVLRPDSTGPYSNSFVRVGQILPAVGDTSSEWELTDAVVELRLLANEPGPSVFFSHSNPDSLFAWPEYRPDSLFRPRAGETYSIRCSWGNLPLLEASTTIPNPPVMVDGSLTITENQVSCRLRTDSSAVLLDVYLVTEGRTFVQRYVPDYAAGNLLQFSTGGRKALELVVFAYDRNLADYYVNSNVSLNFNKYRRPFSYVENGYGVFGSMNLLRSLL